MKTQRKIETIEDLRKEKEVLRGEISKQEEVLRDHYEILSVQLKPAFRFINFISGNRIFKGVKNEDGEGDMDWPSILMKVLLAGGIGGLFLKNSKKNLMRAGLAFALDQGAKFIKEKDLSVYFDKIKEWFAKKEKEVEEE